MPRGILAVAEVVVAADIAVVMVHRHARDVRPIRIGAAVEMRNDIASVLQREYLNRGRHSIHECADRCAGRDDATDPELARMG